jgi:hypothetical protein
VALNGRSGRAICVLATARVCLYRRAERREQLDRVTNRVMEIMK